MTIADTLIVMRGGGDLATGAALRLVRAGFPLVITELEQPRTVRRAVALASAVGCGEIEVEGVKARRAESAEDAAALAAGGTVGVLVDPTGNSIPLLMPRVLVDARMKKSEGDSLGCGVPLVLGLGPGFTAGVNCHAVVETNRGHFLGRVFWQGSAERNTGIPERILGQDRARVLRARKAGIVNVHAEIGDTLVPGQVAARVGGEDIKAPFAGVLRGMISDGTVVAAGDKIGDVDPRGRRELCFMVSDKALAVGGGVLEAVLTWLRQQ
jgi:xanthine dehydrogenase accessory factor